MAPRKLFTFRPPTARQWFAGSILFIAYFIAGIISARIFVAPAVISIGAGVGLAGLVLGGVELWPALYLGALASYLFAHGAVQPFVLILLPIGQTLQAIIGTLLLRKLKFDPMLNHIRDGMAMFFIGIGTAAIVPAVGMSAYALNDYFFNTTPPPVTFGSWWVGVAMGVVVVAPFLTRWFYRPISVRTWNEGREIAVVFAVFLMICILLFFTPVTQIGDISLIYFLLLPLFWIALRIGPRFMTLALFLLGVLGIAGVFLSASHAPAALLGEQVFQTEILIITIAGIFLVLVAIEEERKEALKGLRFHVEKLEIEVGVVSFRERTQSEFIATLAHELRNPLAPMVSSLELLRLEGRVPDESLPLLDEMDARIRTVRRLLDDLLDISRLGQNKFNLQCERVELQKIIASAIRSVQDNFEARNQTISINVESYPIWMEVDAVRIEQVLANLLTNASKFTPEGGTISLSAEKKNGMAEIRVKDDGIGIDPSMLKRIFEPFLQAEQARFNEGLGIGLALAKQLVEMHGGAIEARSEGAGHGSEFVVCIPLNALSGLGAPRESVPSHDGAAVRPPAKTASAGANHIFIVDDNVAAAQSMGKLLELLGYSVDCVYNGTEAIRKAEHVQPGAIILDIGLPDMDGYEAARILRNEKKFSGLLIALTGYGLEEDKQKAYAAGFDHHLTKPIGIGDLRTILKKG